MYFFYIGIFLSKILRVFCMFCCKLKQSHSPPLFLLFEAGELLTFVNHALFKKWRVCGIL